MKRIVAMSILVIFSVLSILTISVPVFADDSFDPILPSSYFTWTVAAEMQYPQNVYFYNNVTAIVENNNVSTNHFEAGEAYVVVTDGNNTRALHTEDLNTNYGNIRGDNGQIRFEPNGVQLTDSTADGVYAILNYPVTIRIYYKNDNIEFYSVPYYNNIPYADTPYLYTTNDIESSYALGFAEATDRIDDGTFGVSFIGDVLTAPFDALNSVTLIETEVGAITLGSIVFMCIGFGLFILFLKLFAGG